MRRAWVAIGWALVALIVWLSLTPSPPTFEISFEQADKVGHAGFYALTMFWFAQLYVRSPVRRGYAVGLIALGIALEFVQGQIGRDFEVADMAADALGVALGWGGALLVPLRFLGR